MMKMVQNTFEPPDIVTSWWRHQDYRMTSWKFSNKRKKNLQIGNMNVSHVNGFEKYGSLIDMNGPWWRHRRWWRHRINQEEVELGRSDFPGGWHSRSSPWPAWTKPHLEFNVPAPQSQKNLKFWVNIWYLSSYFTCRIEEIEFYDLHDTFWRN